MEPRNIGIILWSPEAVSARFVGEENLAGTIAAPQFVARKNRRAYRHWVQYWRVQIGKASLRASRTRMADRKSPAFVDALRLTSKDNFILVKGGNILQEVPRSESQQICDELFADLVEPPKAGSDVLAHRVLTRNWERFSADTGIKRRSDYHKGYELPCTIKGVRRPLEFSYAIANGKPEGLFQRTFLKQPEYVNNAAFVMEAVTEQSHILPKSRCAAVVYAPDSDMDDEAESAMQLLLAFGTVLNLAKPVEAAAALSEMNIPPPADQASDTSTASPPPPESP
jgi:hypothetical protein